MPTREQIRAVRLKVLAYKLRFPTASYAELARLAEVSRSCVRRILEASARAYAERFVPCEPECWGDE